MTKYSKTKFHASADNWEADLAAARSPETSHDTLDMLTESGFEAVRMAVAEHRSTKPFTLAKLVPLRIQSPSDLNLVTALAQNDNTPGYALNRLAERMIEYAD